MLEDFFGIREEMPYGFIRAGDGRMQALPVFAGHRGCCLRNRRVGFSTHCCQRGGMLGPEATQEFRWPCVMLLSERHDISLQKAPKDEQLRMTALAPKYRTRETGGIVIEETRDVAQRRHATLGGKRSDASSRDDQSMLPRWRFQVGDHEIMSFGDLRC